jgi:hypothetical protein
VRHRVAVHELRGARVEREEGREYRC